MGRYMHAGEQTAQTPDEVPEPAGPTDAVPETDTVSAANELSRILPRAFSMASHRNDDLQAVLQPAVEQAIKRAVYAHPAAMARAFAPIAGRAAVRSLLHAGWRFVCWIDRFLQYNLTRRGWAWRLEAIRTNRPFADIVMEHRVAHQVREVFLIHRRTGALLHKAGGAPVAGMNHTDGILDAIQRFSQDSLSQPPEGYTDTILVGEMTVWVEQGPKAILAGLVYGVTTESLRRTFKEALEDIHAEFDSALESFQGDTAPFVATEPYLQACLHTRFRDEGETVMARTWFLVLTVLLGLALWLGHFGWRAVQWNRCVEEVTSQPGIVVAHSRLGFGRGLISGWRDPLAVDPADILARYGFGNARAQWSLHQSSEPAFVVERARRILTPPPGVVMVLDGTELRLKGTAPSEWVTRTRHLANALPGIDTIDTAALTPPPEEKAWRACVERLGREPGIIVISHGMQGDRFSITGMRDPLAVNPALIFTTAGIPTDRIDQEWRAYQSVETPFALARARRALAPPASASLDLAEGVLKARGSAPNAWIRRAIAVSRGLPSITEFDVSELVDSDLERVLPLTEKVEGITIRFMDERADLWPGQQDALQDLTHWMKELDAATRRFGFRTAVTLSGRAPQTADGEGARDRGLALARRLSDILVEQRVPPEMIAISTASAAPDEFLQDRYLVTLRVELLDNDPIAPAQ